VRRGRRAVARPRPRDRPSLALIDAALKFATRTRVVWTLFLDEVGELPAEVQAKLLRAIDTHRIRPVGATAEAPVDARVVAATNRDLVDEVRRGGFRADLYARLAELVVTIDR
jgi:transcriptional regulator of acetoin/glycerol metabolism